MKNTDRNGNIVFLTIAFLIILAACNKGATGDRETPYLVASLVGAIPGNGTQESGLVVHAQAIPFQAATRPAASPPNWNYTAWLTSKNTPTDWELVHGSFSGIAYYDGCYAHQGLRSNNLITGQYLKPYSTGFGLGNQSSWKAPVIASMTSADGHRYWYMAHLGGSTNDSTVWWSKSQDCRNWYRSNGSGGDEMIGLTWSSGTPALAAYNSKLYMAYVPPNNGAGYSIRWKSFDPATRIWTPQSTALPNCFGKTPLAMAEYQGKLYLMARDISPTSTLYYMTYDGTSWSSPVGIPGTESAEFPGPSIISYDGDGLLHLVYVQQGTQNIMYTNFDGNAWAPVQQAFFSDGGAMMAKYNLAIGKGPNGLVLFLDWGGYFIYYAEAR